MADLVYAGLPAYGPLNSTALPASVDIVGYKGDYIQLFFNFKDDSGVALNWTGYTVKAQLKTSYSDQGPINFTTEITGQPGQIRLFLSSSVTKTLIPGSYIWDLQTTDTNGETKTWLAGDVTIYNEVTT